VALRPPKAALKAHRGRRPRSTRGSTRAPARPARYLPPFLNTALDPWSARRTHPRRLAAGLHDRESLSIISAPSSRQNLGLAANQPRPIGARPADCRARPKSRAPVRSPRFGESGRFTAGTRGVKAVRQQCAGGILKGCRPALILRFGPPPSAEKPIVGLGGPGRPTPRSLLAESAEPPAPQGQRPGPRSRARGTEVRSSSNRRSSVNAALVHGFVLHRLGDVPVASLGLPASAPPAGMRSDQLVLRALTTSHLPGVLCRELRRADHPLLPANPRTSLLGGLPGEYRRSR